MHEYESYKPRHRWPEFSVELKKLWLEYYRGNSQPELGGCRHLCSEAVGISSATLNEHMKKDSEFAAAVLEAQQAWIEKNLFQPALQRARDGVEKPIIGGKFKDEVVCTVREYSDRLMEVMLKAHRPEFRDKADAGSGSGGGVGGVLVVPSGPATMAEWQNQYSELAKGKLGAAE
jgi:hypothetical protein